MNIDAPLTLPASPPPAADLDESSATRLPVAENDVHLWRIQLEQPPDRVARLASTLSPDEEARAARFHSERDRLRFVVGRGSLRTILGLYAGCQPGRLRFAYGPHGKPSLAAAFKDSGLQFSLTHSDTLALCAVARDREIGIDLERVRPVKDMHLIAARCFSIRECAELRALPAHLQAPAFFNCWTRKEACLKAFGEGIATALSRVEVSLTPGEPARLLSLDRDSRRAADWTLVEIDASPGYAATLAVHGRQVQPVFQDYASARRIANGG